MENQDNHSLATDSTQFALNEIPQPTLYVGGASAVQFGIVRPAAQLILLFSSDEWEGFIHEWAHAQKQKYHSVRRMSGANDMGIDVAGFTDNLGLHGVWDNFQCKHYAAPLTPSIAILEIGKILWHSYCGQYVPPRACYFVAPRGCGTKLSKLLLNFDKLKEEVFLNWGKCCAEKITTTQIILLEEDFLEYANSFDYSIFISKSTHDILDDHRLTPFYAARFGGGLPDRPDVGLPPVDCQITESNYIQQLFEAYDDYSDTSIKSLNDLYNKPELIEHFNRQREFFYHAEALRNFARDTVPPGTYEDLETEVYAGVADIQSQPYDNGFLKMNAITQNAASLQLTANALISVVKVQDRKGICHQLANVNRLRWTKSKS